jgi:hypothetical protein
VEGWSQSKNINVRMGFVRTVHIICDRVSFRLGFRYLLLLHTCRIRVQNKCYINKVWMVHILSRPATIMRSGWLRE